MTVAAILDACCPPLETVFVEELLTGWHVNPDEAADIYSIVQAWGEEPAHGRGREALRAEIRDRVVAYLRVKRAETNVSAGAVH